MEKVSDSLLGSAVRLVRVYGYPEEEISALFHITVDKQRALKKAGR